MASVKRMKYYRRGGSILVGKVGQYSTGIFTLNKLVEGSIRTTKPES